MFTNTRECLERERYRALGECSCREIANGVEPFAWFGSGSRGRTANRRRGWRPVNPRFASGVLIHEGHNHPVPPPGHARSSPDLISPEFPSGILEREMKNRQTASTISRISPSSRILGRRGTCARGDFSVSHGFLSRCYLQREHGKYGKCGNNPTQSPGFNENLPREVDAYHGNSSRLTRLSDA